MAMIGASLEKLIGKKLVTTNVTSDVGDVIATQAYYLVTVAEEVATRGENQAAIASELLVHINNSFNTYVDAKASTPAGHRKFHSVYEFGMSGDPSARLWYHQRWSGNGFAKSTVYFKTAKNPNREGYPFKEKAYVMQSGTPVVITPKNSKVLAFQNRKTLQMVYTPGPVFVEHPGGKASEGSLNAAYTGFWYSGIPKKIMADRKLLNKILKSTRNRTSAKSAASVRADAAAQALKAVKQHTGSKDA